MGVKTHMYSHQKTEKHHKKNPQLPVSIRQIGFLHRNTVWRRIISPHQTSAVSEISPDNHIKISCLMDWCLNEQTQSSMENRHTDTKTHTRHSTRLNRGEKDGLKFPLIPFVADWVLKCTQSRPGAEQFELLHIRVYSALQLPADCNLVDVHAACVPYTVAAWLLSSQHSLNLEIYSQV